MVVAFITKRFGDYPRSSTSQGTTVQVQRVRRDATKVIYEILSLGVNGASKTHIIYKVNLSFKLAERYIVFLTAKGLLEKETNSEGVTKYLLTARGERLLQSLREVEKELGDLFLKSPSSGIRVQGLV